jgi:uncharacterized protein YndB with AHSA1/START domain
MSSSQSDESEFVFTRAFDAPRELVFKAWTEPERLAQWWGPKGSTIVVKKMDLRPGGIFHYAMRRPQGEMVVLGILAWGGLFLRDERLRELIPVHRA